MAQSCGVRLLQERPDSGIVSHVSALAERGEPFLIPVAGVAGVPSKGTRDWSSTPPFRRDWLFVIADHLKRSIEE